MKIIVENQEKAKEVRTFTWAEMVANPGLYRPHVGFGIVAADRDNQRFLTNYKGEVVQFAIDQNPLMNVSTKSTNWRKYKFELAPPLTLTFTNEE